jgi:hypothetical protein
MTYAAALALAVAMAVPASASAVNDQNIEAGFQPQTNANVVFGQPASLSNKPSKKGTLRAALFFSDIVGTPPSLETVDVHLPEEMKIDGKGLPQCRPEQLEGQTPENATAACKKSLVGNGFATALGLTEQGDALMFNGTGQTILVHIFTANVPIVLVGELRSSPLGSPYGQVLHVPVSTSAGGGVPPGIVVTRTEFTQISKAFKDKKLVKKAKKAKKQGNTKKAKKLKKKAKKTFVSASCTDGTLSYRADFDHAPPAADQSPTYEQPCTS